MLKILEFMHINPVFKGVFFFSKSQRLQMLVFFLNNIFLNNPILQLQIHAVANKIPSNSYGAYGFICNTPMENPTRHRRADTHTHLLLKYAACHVCMCVCSTTSMSITRIIDGKSTTRWQFQLP